MVQEKPWWTSKGVIGGLVAAFSPVLGLSVSDTVEWTDILMDLITAGAGLYAVYGRVVAKHTVTIK